MNDNDILALYFERNERAIAESAKKYGAYCQSIADNILKCREDTEECVNDTWLRAWNCIPPERPRYLYAFFGRITRHLALDRYRAAHRSKRIPEHARLATEELDALFADHETPQDLLEAKALGEALNCFLGTLKKRERDIFLCRYYFLWQTEEIAARHGIRENYVRNLLSRTRKKLKLYLEQEGFGI